MADSWQRGPVAALDVETTGTDVENDRVVQAAFARIGPTGVEWAGSWLVDPGIDIPPGATAVHGITTERARAEGFEPASVLAAVAGHVGDAWAAGIPVVVMKADFDLTLLDREMRRHFGVGLELTERSFVLDPLVIDRACDPYRPGGRKLGDLAAHYQVKQADAHDALGDCLTAARVIWRQVRLSDGEAPGRNGRPRKLRYSVLRMMTLAEMQTWQVRQHAEWAAGYQHHLRTRAKSPQPNAVVDPSWPWRPHHPAREKTPA